MAVGSEIGTAWILVKAKPDAGFAASLGGIGSDAGGIAGELFNTKFSGILTKLPGILAAIGIGKVIGDFIGDSVEVGKQFDKAMSQVAATMGTTVDEIQDLRNFAQEMGASTAYSATEAAEALNYMALAGYDAETSMSMLPNVLNLAASGNIELARASDMVTDAQSALGLSLEDTTVMVDQMAKTASTTNTSVEQLGDAFLTVGGTAKMLQGGTAELSQVLGLLADNGIKGSEGGTALRNVLLSLASPTNEASAMLKSLGVEVFDAEGNMRSMQDVMQDLNAAMDGMTSEERTNAISTIFNKRDLKSVEALLGTTADRWDEVAEAIDNAQGSAQAMADTQLDNLEGDVTLLQSAWQGLQIKVSDIVTPAIREFTQFATSAISAVTGFVEENQGAFDALGYVLKTIAGILTGVVGGAFSTIIQILGSCANAVSMLMQGFTNFATKMGEVFRGVVNIVSNAINTIKGLFNFSFSLPHIPLPHFGINPPGWQIGDLLKGVIPSLGISWYAKGGILDGATLIGVGEAGPEAVVPLTAPNLAPFAEAVAERIGGGIYIQNMTVEANDVDEFIMSVERRLGVLGAM